MNIERLVIEFHCDIPALAARLHICNHFQVGSEKRERLKQVAKSRNVSVNKLIDEMATLAITEHDAETRFRIRAERGRGGAERGLRLLRKAAGGVRRA